MSGAELLPRALNRLLDDGFDVVGIDAELVTDVNRPDLRTQVRLEVELAAHISASRLAVLTDHDERRQEDGLQADDHGQQTKRKLVELQRRAEKAHVEEDPNAEPEGVQVDEVQRSRKRG